MQIHQPLISVFKKFGPGGLSRTVPADIRADLLYTVISAIFFTSSFTFSQSAWFSFFCLVPFFIAIEKAGSWKRTALFALLWGALITFGISYWLYSAIHGHFGKTVPFTLLFMFIAGALPMGILYVLFSLVYRLLLRQTIIFHAAVIPSLWVACEFIRELMPVFLPWGLLGYTLTDYTYLIQMADITGVYGVSFLLVLTNSLLLYLLKITVPRLFPGDNYTGTGPAYAFHGRKEISAACLILLTAWAAASGYGVYTKSIWDKRVVQSAVSPGTRSVSIVQGNFGQRERWRNDSFDERLETYINLSELSDPRTRPRIIVWPETVLNSPRRFTPALISRLISMLRTGDLLIAGGLRKNSENQTFNTAWLITSPGQLKWYDKNIMLPFAESNPLNVRLLERFYEAPSRYTPGSTPSAIGFAGKIFGLSICFESIYSGYVGNSIQNGAEILVNLSNDTWFGDSSEPHQHLRMAMMRAVEYRRFMLRAANSGISAVISPAGTMLSGSKLFERSTVQGVITSFHDMTIYQSLRYGVIYFALAVLLINFGLMIFRP